MSHMAGDAGAELSSTRPLLVECRQVVPLTRAVRALRAVPRRAAAQRCAPPDACKSTALQPTGLPRVGAI